MSILFSALLMGGTGLLFSIFLVIANKTFHVEIDPRISKIEETLPGVNCGGCGYASCVSYAEAIVKKGAKLNQCVVADEETLDALGTIMGTKVEKGEKKIAVVMCRGDRESAKFPGIYKGIQDCAAAIYSGDVAKRCKYGCIGLGSCVSSCPFNAIKISAHGIPVVSLDRCTGCGNCVEACPRGLIELHPVSQKIHVYCKSYDPGAIYKTVCTNACIGCGLCVKAAEADGKPDVLKITNNLVIVNYDNYQLKPEYIEKCPTGAINIEQNIIIK